MKTKFFLLGTSAFLLASCSNELDLPPNEVFEGSKTPLSVNVATESISKALVSGTTLPGGSKIGVKLVNSDGANYDNQTYNNIYYSTTDGTTWAIDATKSILLSSTEGKAFAYFPYVVNASLDFTAIPISSAANPNDQVDYMYGNVASGLKNSNPTASFTMSHAMSIVNFEIAKGSYTGTGAITSVMMKGNTASNTGTMNAVAGTVTATNSGYEFTSTNSLTLGSSSTGKFIVVPSGTSSALDFKVVMDGQTYTASTADVTLESGRVYKYTLTMNSTGLTVSTVTVTPWGAEQDKGSLDSELYNPSISWTEAKAIDGVYAIYLNGNPVPYITATSSDDTYKGVAFVLNGKAYQVAKVDATGYDGASDVYWWKSRISDISGLNNYSNADNTNSSGYLPKVDGTFWGSPHLDSDWTQWSSYTSTTAALSDFKGKENTDLILAAQSNGTINYTLGKAVIDFRGNDSVNEGYADWFVPACGELAFMYLNKTKLETLLNKASGTVFTKSDYWSSSEYSYANVWRVSLNLGRVNSIGKDYCLQLRLVREI